MIEKSLVKRRCFTIPNMITTLRILLILLLPLLNNKWLLAGVATLIVFGDFDGVIARKLNQVTKIGAGLDKVADLLFVIVSIVFFLIHT
ncbi:MAG: CDP-alcohol phosphatidyltransferase family protein, partial [Candidatus Woesearchaeota archaeon]|nr:CDP-alcohol phosphatidyltransferase family protein [Candidatus Woesearchaeota archaeon]